MKENFWMNVRMQAGRAEAPRLTRTGRLAEATKSIQRTLRGEPAPDVSRAEPNSADTPIEGEFRVVDDSPPATGSSMKGMAPGIGPGTGAVKVRPAARIGVVSPGTIQ